MSRLSISVSHTPWRPERAKALEGMRRELGARLGLVHDADYRGRDWQEAKVEWALQQWCWHAASDAEWCLLLTDDLHLMPGFVDELKRMLAVVPFSSPVGLLSNHPQAHACFRRGWHWYATNSWLVGPAYAIARDTLRSFLAWYETLPYGPHTTPGTKAWANDDSSLNEWVTRHGGGRTVHPLPTLIEHRADLESTVGHGDRHSRERLSWRWSREVRDNAPTHLGPGGFTWIAVPFECAFDEGFWAARGGPEKAPMLVVGEGGELPCE